MKAQRQGYYFGGFMDQRNYHDVAPLVRLEDVRQVAARIGRGSSWIWAAVRRGEFPAPKKLSTRCTRWNSRAVDSWIENQFAEESE